MTKEEIRPLKGLAIIIALSIVPFWFVTISDYQWTLFIREHNWRPLYKFMDRTIFEGEMIGGGDPVIAFLIIMAVGYYLSWKGYLSDKWTKHRPNFGFIITSALVSGVFFVHSIKWIIGRARPKLVIKKGLTYSDWYEFGSHFITEGIYRGSFPSGHTVQAFLIITLAYILAANPYASSRQRILGWVIGALALVYASIMGIGRCMSLSHWLSDVVGGLIFSWIIIHAIYYWLLRVPDQLRYQKKFKQLPQTPVVWEVQICMLLFVTTVSFMAVCIGFRALFFENEPLISALIPVGLFAGALTGFYLKRLYHRIWKAYATNEQ